MPIRAMCSTCRAGPGQRSTRAASLYRCGSTTALPAPATSSRCLRPGPRSATCSHAAATSSAEQITLSNDGLADLHIAGASITGSGASAFTLLDANPADYQAPLYPNPFPVPSTVVPGGQTFAWVDCTGPQTEGRYDATVTFSTDDGGVAGSTVSFPVVCYVDNTPPTVAVTPPTLTAATAGLRRPPSTSACPVTTAERERHQLLELHRQRRQSGVDIQREPDLSGRRPGGQPHQLYRPRRRRQRDAHGHHGPCVTGQRCPDDQHAGESPPNAAGWSNSDTSVSFGCTDATPGSGLASTKLPVNAAVSTETAGQVVSSGPCQDVAGNQAVISSVTMRSWTRPRPTAPPSPQRRAIGSARSPALRHHERP